MRRSGSGAKPLAVARARNEDIPTTAQLRSCLAMLASNRGRTFAITLKALPEDTQHDITGGTYRGPLAQEFRSWCESGKDTSAGFSQNHIWLRGSAETVFALEEIRAGQVLG
jgi:hypothetical protein